MKCKVCKCVSVNPVRNTKYFRRESKISNGVKKIVFVIIVLSLLTVNIDFCLAQTEEKKPAVIQEKISLDLKGVDILELFKMLSVKSGLNIIPSKNVSGRINIFLNNLTFEDALEVILINQNLAYERKDDIITVITQAEYQELFGKKFIEKRKVECLKLKYTKPANAFSIINQIKSDIGKIIVDEASGTILLIDIPEKLELMKETIKQLDRPLKTEIFEFNYSQTKNMKAYLESLATPNLGSIIVDERTNKAVVSDLAERVNNIRSVVEAFDEAPRQVFIQGEIVQVTLSNKFQRGIEWEKVYSEKTMYGLDFVGKFPVSSTLSAYQKISVGTLTTDDYEAILNLLQEYGRTKIISRPQILVVNNQEAKIMVGAREAYVTQTLSQAETTTVTSETVQFVDVGVKLNVVPSIGKDGFITMKIKPEVSSVRETIKTITGSLIPIVETSESETVVKVKDGTTIMIAGLMKDEKRDSTQGLPVLSRIPFLGMFFGNRSSEQPKRSELIVFLTPQLVSGDVSVEAEVKTKKEAKKPEIKAKKAEKETAVVLDIRDKLKGPKY